MRQNFPYVGAVYAFFVQGNKILLLRRTNTNYMDGMRSVPAGHMDGQELAHDALIREVHEEVGVQLSYDQLQKPITLFRITANNNGTERFELFFLITKRDGNITNNEPHKCDALERFDMTDLPINTIPYIKTMIKSYQQQKNFVEINEETNETYML